MHLSTGLCSLQAPHLSVFFLPLTPPSQPSTARGEGVAGSGTRGESRELHGPGLSSALFSLAHSSVTCGEIPPACATVPRLKAPICDVFSYIPNSAHRPGVTLECSSILFMLLPILYWPCVVWYEIWCQIHSTSVTISRKNCHSVEIKRHVI